MKQHAKGVSVNVLFTAKHQERKKRFDSWILCSDDQQEENETKMLLLLTNFMLRHWKYTEMVWKIIILEGQISWDKIYTPGKWGQKEAIEDGWTKVLRSKLIREQNEMSGQQVEKDVIKSHVIVSLHCKIEAQVKTLFHTFVNQMPEHFEFYSEFRVSVNNL